MDSDLEEDSDRGQRLYRRDTIRVLHLASPEQSERFVWHLVGRVGTRRSAKGYATFRLDQRYRHLPVAA